MAVYRGRSTWTLGATSMLAVMLRWVAILLVAAIQACGSGPTSKPANLIRVDLGGGADSLCLVGAASVNCTDVGEYLRDTLQIPLSADIHLSVDRRIGYDRAAVMLKSVLDAGYTNLGFVADVNPSPVAPN